MDPERKSRRKQREWKGINKIIPPGEKGGKLIRRAPKYGIQRNTNTATDATDTPKLQR